MVEPAGVEPAVSETADLQSTGVTNFPTTPYLLTLSAMLLDASQSRE